MHPISVSRLPGSRCGFRLSRYATRSPRVASVRSTFGSPVAAHHSSTSCPSACARDSALERRRKRSSRARPPHALQVEGTLRLRVQEVLVQVTAAGHSAVVIHYKRESVRQPNLVENADEPTRLEGLPGGEHQGGGPQCTPVDGHYPQAAHSSPETRGGRPAGRLRWETLTGRLPVNR